MLQPYGVFDIIAAKLRSNHCYIALANLIWDIGKQNTIYEWEPGDAWKIARDI